MAKKNAPKKKAAKKKAAPKAVRKKKSAAKKATPNRPPASILDRKYKKSFLKQVIARIDFATPIASLGDGPPKGVIAALKSHFPVPEQKKQVLQQVFVTESEVHRGKHETFQWYYHSKERDKRVYIGADAMYVEYSNYNRFEELNQDFLTVCNALFDEIADLQIKRLGLRYIDNIEFSREKDLTDWSKYLHEDLLASFRLADDRSRISRAFHVLEFNYGDMSMRLQYGMPNPDFPAAIRKKLFVLDYDAYCTLLLGRDDIAPRLTEFHDKIKESFEQVITDGLRNVMGILHAK